MAEYRIQRLVECEGNGCTGGECQTTGVWETLEGWVTRRKDVHVGEGFYEFIEDDEGILFRFTPPASPEQLERLRNQVLERIEQKRNESSAQKGPTLP